MAWPWSFSPLPQPPVFAPGEDANGRFAELITIRPDAKTKNQAGHVAN
jgi:hypothetical protein